MSQYGTRITLCSVLLIYTYSLQWRITFRELTYLSKSNIHILLIIISHQFLDFYSDKMSYHGTKMICYSDFIDSCLFNYYGAWLLELEHID